MAERRSQGDTQAPGALCQGCRTCTECSSKVLTRGRPPEWDTRRPVLRVFVHAHVHVCSCLKAHSQPFPTHCARAEPRTNSVHAPPYLGQTVQISKAWFGKHFLCNLKPWHDSLMSLLQVSLAVQALWSITKWHAHCVLPETLLLCEHRLPKKEASKMSPPAVWSPPLHASPGGRRAVSEAALGTHHGGSGA